MAIVTGGAGHLGFAMGSALAEVGAQVVLVDIDLERVTAAAEQVAADTGVRACGIACDLADENAVRRLPERVVADFGRLDILINNAAFVGTSGLDGWAEPFERQTSASWRLAMEVNLTAVFSLVQASTPFLRKSGCGSIVNIGSIYGFLGPDWSLYGGTKMANPAAYAASKGGLIQLTRWLATTLGPDIRVNCVSPGGVARGQPESFTEQYVARTPLGRMATEEDFKGAAVYLAGDLSRYVTGQHLVVDGGWSVW
ncbi:MAG TPA: SDR family oxidoreductase [Xanthobacteraceae bacterium]|nr:SDR family oxidoreductase [Xanthobacteraceae bacterium]